MTIKVLVVDDSFVMRTLIKDIVVADADLEVVGDAANGKLALDQVKALNPDIILLDIEMPEMDGLECLKRLKLLSRAKVIIVSSLGQMGSPQTLEAYKLGAVAVVEKPSGAMSLDLGLKKGHEIIKAVRKAAGLP
ncbi:MAG: response regulator [Methylococcaceae bacterium]|nr:MAG: response regulator [Methylococcaceae bacterium]